MPGRNGESTAASEETTESLVALRRRIHDLAVADGVFVVRCARTGGRPVPVRDCRFPDRESAARAARLTETYRTRLRVWDARTPYRDPVVHEEFVGTRCPPDADGTFPATLVERVREQSDR